MLGDGYENGQVPLFHVFVRIFGLDPAQNTPFFRGDNQSNLSIKLCATNLRARAKRKQKIEQGHGQFNIDCNNIVLAFVEAYFIIFYAIFS